jgi:fructuronate reductase
MGIDDKGNPFTISPDPLYPSLFPFIEGIKLGDTGPFHAQLEPIFSNSRIFGVNLYEAGLGEKVESYFAELVTGPGAVAAALEKYTGEESCQK